MTGLLSNPAWGKVLIDGMGCSVVAVPFADGAALSAWTVFSRGPLSVAYPRFPIGLVEGDQALLADLPNIAARLRGHGVKLLRMSAPLSLLAGQPEIAVETRLDETVITDLSSWSADAVPATLRRKFRQGDKAGLLVAPVQAHDGRRLHELYRGTLARHWGSSRYTQRYFEQLCLASQGSRDLSVAKVMTREGQFAAFVAVAADAGTAYYLHGGYADAFSASRPGYFAMRWALEQARDRGNHTFNFLTSPPGQTALRDYKESFGGRSHPRCHWQVPLTPLGRLAAQALRLLAARTKPSAADRQASASKSTSA